MKADFGIEITPQAIAYYDPTRYSTSPCPKRWSDLFWTMRAEFIASVADVGAAHPTVRVRRLDQMACDQMEKGNTAEARALLKQAADEMSRMSGQKDDGNDATDSKQSEAELRAGIAAKLGLAVGRSRAGNWLSGAHTCSQNCHCDPSRFSLPQLEIGRNRARFRGVVRLARRHSHEHRHTQPPHPPRRWRLRAGNRGFRVLAPCWRAR